MITSNRRLVLALLAGAGSALSALAQEPDSCDPLTAVVAWEQRSTANPGAVNTLPAGANVNPSPTSEVRLRISQLGAWTVQSIQLFEDDPSINRDDPLQLLGGQPAGEDVVTPWMSPPMQVGDGGFHAEFYVLVTLRCREEATLRSSLINVPDGVVNEDIERTLTESTTELGGSIRFNVGPLEANISIRRRSETERRRTIDFAATYRDPDIDVGVETLAGPPGWSGFLHVDPALVVIGPGQGASVDLLVPPETPLGEGFIRFTSDVQGTGLHDETDILKLEVFDDDSARIGTMACYPPVENSTGDPAWLSAFGSTDIGRQDVVLTVANVPDGDLGYLVASQTAGLLPTPGGSQGNLCVLGNQARYTAHVGTGPYMRFDVGSMLVPTNPPPGQPILPGETWYWQCWYRDGAESNFTNAIEITFD